VKRLELEPRDLLGLRFAHSPMAEVVASTLALHGPQWMFTRWRGTVTPRVRTGLDTFWSVFDTPTCAIADFLTPVPRTARPTLDDELGRIAATPLDRVAFELTTTGVAFGDPAATLATLVTQIRRYFDLAVAPLWPRLRASAEAEIAGRALTAAAHGPGALLTGLHPNIRWDDDKLHLDYLKPVPHPPWFLDGHPLHLMPTGFTGPAAWIMNSADGRALWYPPRAHGTLWTSPAPPSAPAALAGLLGPTRAAVLTLLAAPSSTGDVAAALRLAPATASHHLTALRDAGLIVADRVGRRLHYRRTDLGDRLATLG